MKTHLQVPLQSCDILTARLHVIQGHLTEEENDSNPSVKALSPLQTTKPTHF